MRHYTSVRPWVRKKFTGDTFTPRAEETEPDRVPPPSPFITKTERKRLIASIRQLPPREAAVIVMHYLHDLPLPVVSKRLRLSPHRVLKYHNDALERLHQATRSPSARHRAKRPS